MSIQIKNLNYIYSKGTVFEKKALDNINLEITTGEFVGLIGHTGSGKSTLAQHLNALLKPDSGEILINGENINADKSKLKSVRCKVGLVFQYPEHQLFETSIYKDVAFGPLNMGISTEETDERVRRALEIVGIAESDYEKSPFDLSGGQKRRAAIAGVLAMRPEILVLDEPAAGLDPRGRDEILEQIAMMHDKLKLTTILVSHSMEDIALYANRIIVINRGAIAFDGSVSEIFEKADDLEEMGLAAPQATYLMKALDKKGFGMPKGVYTVDAAVDAIYNMIKNKRGT